MPRFTANTLLAPLVVLASLVAGALAGCQGNRSEEPPVHLIQNMDFQARFDAQEENPFFQAVDCANALNHGCKGRAARAPVPGTVAVGQLKDDDELYRGRGADGRLFDRLPSSVPLSAELLDRGRSATTSTASPATTRPAAARASPPCAAAASRSQPANMQDPRLRAMPLGYFYDVITNGKGTMLPYAAQIPVKDRWAIAAWVRTLQAARTSEGK
jgi:hypothetical protein